jgi:hypothetical protein
MDVKHFANGNALTWFGDEFFKNVEDKYIKRMLLRATAEFEMLVQNLIRMPKSGIVYKIPHSRVRYTSSAPGEAPAVRSGRLRQSIRHVIKKTGPLEWSAFIGSTVATYPAILETGSKFMKPRPLWQPALVALGRRMNAIIRVDRLP